MQSKRQWSEISVEISVWLIRESPFSNSNDNCVTFRVHVPSGTFFLRATDTGAKSPLCERANVCGVQEAKYPDVMWFL